MMAIQVDMAGRKYGELIAIRRIGSAPNNRNAIWLFRCSCGAECEKDGYSVRSGKVKACTACGLARSRAASITHGKTNSVEYRIWTGMLTRCYNKSARAYADYGRRGISVCESWRHDFDAFLHDMGHRPSPQHSIDRIDNDGNYQPSNCRWATREQQAQNKRTSIRIEIDGQCKTVDEWANESGQSAASIYQRYRSGLRGAAVLKTTVTTIDYDGITDTVSGWSRRTGIKPTTILQRIRVYGWPISKALSQGAAS